jgi:hypothetical protein
MIKNSFREDIEFLYNRLSNKDKFSFSKYADGEFAILANQNITNVDNWTFDSTKHDYVRDQLIESFKFNDPDYYVGVSCICCQPVDHVMWMREQSQQDKLTWANIFVNSNYPYFVDKFIPEFSNHKVILFARDDARYTELPFAVDQFVPITSEAMIDNFELVNEFPVESYKDYLFLFCAGPLGNMLAAKFWEKNKTNTYLDIGSTLNPYLTETNRSYLRGGATELKTCIW